MQSTVDYQYNDYKCSPDPPHQPHYLKAMLKYLRSDTEIRTILDAGCGDGNFAQSLAEAGYKMYGIDMSESGIAIAKSRGRGSFALSSVYENMTSPFDEIRSFDAIVAIETIEHLYSPRIFVKRIYEALRPGGLVIVTCPYWGYLKNILLAVTGRLDGLLTALWDGGHIKHWSRRTLTTLFEEQDFKFVAFYGAGKRPPYLYAGMMMVFRKA